MFSRSITMSDRLHPILRAAVVGLPLIVAFAVQLLTGVFFVGADEIRIASTGPGINILPIEVASRKGFFRDEGLEVLNITMRANIAVNALLTRGVDYATPSTSSVKAAWSFAERAKKELERGSK